MKFHHLITASAAVLALSLSATVSAEKLAVGITPDLQKLDFKHDGKSFTIMRNQDQKNTINENFAKTSRKCPPFCIQPIVLAPGVETLGEVEIIHYIKKMSEGENILVVDSRTPDWVERGTIPGAKNIPWTRLNPAKGATTEGIIEVMTKEFGAKLAEGADAFTVDEAVAEGNASKAFDYSQAKTLVMFCNGMWCGQSPNNILNLLKFGYPAEKLKWYRGGMQDWEVLGLSTVKP
ncbi:MAG: rhodanese-like domain-containing protein [Gammaproteobacteria bacterium]|jgi:rhodanese-related sulfurtransferase